MINKSELKAAVQEVLAEILGVEVKPPVAHNRQWYSAEEACRLLDLNSAEKLHKKRRNGLLREGFHFRNDNNSASARIPRWLYHVERCREELAKKAAQRKPYKR